MLKPVIALAVLVVVLIIAFFAWRSHHKASSAQVSPSASSVWLNYKSDKYGFEFTYPSKWGSPSITKNSDTQAVKESGSKQTGNTYTVSFSKASGSNSSNVVSILLNSSDYSVTTCSAPNNCSRTGAATANTVNANISSNKSLWKHDNSSYSNHSFSQAADMISITQIVDLPKINVSAAVLVYRDQSPSSSCPKNTLSTDTGNCVTVADYNDLQTVAKSIKSTN